MRWSVYGTVASWLAYGAIVILWASYPILVGLGLLLALGFTLVLVAHVVVFTARTAALWNGLRTSSPAAARTIWPTRRAFVTGVLGAGMTAVVVAALGQRTVGQASAETASTASTTETTTTTASTSSTETTTTTTAAEGCKPVRSAAPPFTFVCKGECPTLFDAAGKAVAGICTFVTTARGGRRAGNFECVCIYKPDKATCKIELVEKGKPTERLECTGTCPDLFAKGEKQAIKGDCLMIAVPRKEGGVEFQCVCVY